MKVIKAMKKLKFWSRKKKKNKFLHLSESPPPPSRPPPPPPRPYPPIHSQYEPLLPSAPPLPPWLEYDLQFQESDAEPSSPNSTNNSHSHSHFSPTQEEIYFDDHETCHQEIWNPMYDDAIVPKIEKLERGGGAFGCVVGFGVHLVRCVFPCFHIREVVRSNKGSCVIT
ncbi:hypothetical protein ABFS83_14G086100 [Erythranthe nasuta]